MNALAARAGLRLCSCRTQVNQEIVPTNPTDHLFHLHIGPDRQPFSVTQECFEPGSVFENLSIGTGLLGDPPGTLHFSFALPREDPAVFRTFLYAVHNLHQVLPLNLGVRRWLDMYCVARDYQMPGFKNNVVHQIARECLLKSPAEVAAEFGPAVIETAWRVTAPGSGLRRLVVDLLVHVADGGAVLAWLQEAVLHAEGLARMITEYDETYGAVPGLEGRRIVMERMLWGWYDDQDAPLFGGPMGEIRRGLESGRLRL